MAHLDNFYHQRTGPADSPLKLVFLHGLMGYTANWRRIAKAFEDRFDVLVYDQRGHGRSFQPESGYSPDDYADDLRRIIDELGREKIHLVGHSMGGRAALAFASSPEGAPRLTRLVIEDIGPNIVPEGANFILRLLDSVPVPFPSKRDAKQWFESTFLELFTDQRQKEGLAAYLYANLIENERKEAVWRFSEAGIRESVLKGREEARWEEFAQLAMPTLLVRGEFSRDLPRDVYDRVLASNPQVDGVEIPGAGHWVHSDQPELFISALQRFFGASGT